MRKRISETAYIALFAMINVLQLNAAAYDADDAGSATSASYVYSDDEDDAASTTVKHHSYAEVEAIVTAHYPGILSKLRSIGQDYTSIYDALIDHTKPEKVSGGLTDNGFLMASIMRKGNNITKTLSRFGINHTVPACESVYHHKKLLGYAWPTQGALCASQQFVMNALYDVFTARLRLKTETAGAGAGAGTGAAEGAVADTAAAYSDAGVAEVKA